jgi:hypothetical protein
VEDSRANIGVRLGHLFVATRDINEGEEIVLHSGRTTLLSLQEPANVDTPDPLQKLHLVSGGAPRTPENLVSILLFGGDQSPRAESREASCAAVAASSDLVEEPSMSLGATLARAARRTFSVIGSFMRGAVVEDWMAAPIAFVGSMTATFATALCVARIAPVFEQIFNSTTSPGYVLATSTTAIVLGYASYCLFYWSGMLWKERAELRDESGALSKERVEEKLKVFMWDFLLHLPSDGYWAVAMFGVQGGLYASGSTDLFWSIMASQGLSDIYYSLREPFYWRAAKNTAAKLAERRSSMAKDVANSDIAPPPVTGEVGNG